MNSFKEYSQYYDLLYRNKEYVEEVDYVVRVLQGLRKSECSLLDMGCGTGKHAALLQERGFAVTGVDISDTMLEQARRNFGEMADFIKSDIRGLNLDRTFDVIISLFHVISYQVSDEDLDATFNSVFRHLNPGGYFIFDCRPYNKKSYKSRVLISQFK